MDVPMRVTPSRRHKPRNEERTPLVTLVFFGLRLWVISPQAPSCSSESDVAFLFSMASASTSTQAPAQAGKSTQPLVAQGDWTKNLVQLAKTAELK